MKKISAAQRKTGALKRPRRIMKAGSLQPKRRVMTEALTEVLPRGASAVSSSHALPNIETPSVIRRVRRLPSFFWGFLSGVAMMSVLFFLVVMVLFLVV